MQKLFKYVNDELKELFKCYVCFFLPTVNDAWGILKMFLIYIYFPAAQMKFTTCCY